MKSKRGRIVRAKLVGRGPKLQIYSILCPYCGKKTIVTIKLHAPGITTLKYCEHLDSTYYLYPLNRALVGRFLKNK